MKIFDHNLFKADKFHEPWQPGRDVFPHGSTYVAYVECADWENKDGQDHVNDPLRPLRSYRNSFIPLLDPMTRIE